MAIAKKRWADFKQRMESKPQKDHGGRGQMPRRGGHGVIIYDNLIAMSKKVSPIGKTAAQTAEVRGKKSAAYRKEQAARAPFQEIAWLLIKYRMDRGLTQYELAERVGTSYTQISRIESGRHRPNVETLLRIAHALDLKMLLGFEKSTEGAPAERDLVTLNAATP